MGQKQEFRAAFDIFVEDSTDGTITDKELGKVFRMLGQNPTEAELQELAEAFRIFDTKGDGYIDKEELQAALALTGEPVQDWELDGMLNDGDKNEDGCLDYEEWIDMMKHTPQI